MKKYTRIISLIICAMLCAGAFAGCSGGNKKTLFVACDSISGYFSPFFSRSAPDSDVAKMVSVNLLDADRAGEVISKGKTGEERFFNGTEYSYDGIADITSDGADAPTLTIELRNDIKFSDGTQLTADDVLFSFYVLSDPAYMGRSKFSALPIEGMVAYRTENLTAGQKTQLEDAVEEYRARAWNASVKFATVYNDFDKAIALKYELPYYVDDEGALLYTADDVSAALTGNELTLIDLFISRAVNSSAFDWVHNYTLDELRYFGFFGSTKAEVYYSAAMAELFAISYREYVTEVNPQAGYADIGKDVTDDFSGPDAALGFLSAEETKQVKDGDTLIGTYKAKYRMYFAFYADYIEDILAQERALKTREIKGSSFVRRISGIRKVNDYKITVKFSEFSESILQGLKIIVAPMHYYGEKAKFVTTAGSESFGFVKYNLTHIESKSATPMGAGAYKFAKFSDSTVHFEANPYYYKGVAKIKKIQFKTVSESEKISGTASGLIDVSYPVYNKESLALISSSGSKLHTVTTADSEYWYIGMNAERIKNVDDPDGGAELSKSLRKGFATLFAFRREQAEEYFGMTAELLNYPVSNSSWAAPAATDAGYERAFAVDASGAAIYSAAQTKEQARSAAIAAAASWFIDAGCHQGGDGKFIDVPEYTIHVPADRAAYNPMYLIIDQVIKDLSDMGIRLKVRKHSDLPYFYGALDDNILDMWCAVWEAGADLDFESKYSGKNAGIQPDSANSNRGFIRDAELDQLILGARSAGSQSERKAKYLECMEIVMDWAVEVPCYQRLNAAVIRTSKVNLSTLPKDITAFWQWDAELHKLELK